MKALIVVVMTLVPAIAAADAGHGTGHVLPVLPSVRLEAKSTGKATFAVGADITWGRSEFQDVTLSPVYRTSTNQGVQTLLLVNDDGITSPADWELGLEVTLSVLRPFSGVPTQSRLWNQNALEICLARCQGETIREADKTFCKKANDALAEVNKTVRSTLRDTDIYQIQDSFTNPGKDYCPSGISYLKKMDELAMAASRDKMAVIPQWTLSMGLLGGATHHEFLRPDAETPDQLTPDSSVEAAMSGAAQVTHVTDDRLTVEIAARLQSKNSAGSRTARWCESAGAVMRDDGTSDTAEVCSERVIGAPVRKKTVDGMLLLGGISRTHAMRASGGVFVSYEPVDHADDSMVYGFKFPMMLATDMLPGKGVYKGILRITPVLALAETSADETDTRLYVTVEVLTSRSLFGTALDAF